VDTRGKKKKRTSKENVDGRCTSSHENKTFRSRSVVKQKGMVVGFRKTATAVTRPERQIDSCVYMLRSKKHILEISYYVPLFLSCDHLIMK